jgi:DNA-binding protein H-NS
MPTSVASLKTMSVDRLMKLREDVIAAISVKVTEEQRALHEKLSMLDRLSGGARAKGVRSGPRGAVPPKYRNPDNPAETWAGRGLKPRWLAAAIKAGGKLEDYAIGAKPRGRAKKRA